MAQPIRHILFKHSIELPGGGATTTQVDAGERRLSVDKRDQVVSVDNRDYPMSSVQHIEYEPLPNGAEPIEAAPETCPECGKTLSNAKALGAHRKHKHGVKGKRSEQS